MRVLIVEDDAAVRGIVRDQLESRGVGIVSAGSLAASRQALAGGDFQAIILDLALPDGSGLELLAELRASGSSAHVIVLTGAGSEEDRVHAIESGADDYVVKPFFARELAARVLAVERRRSLTEDTTLRIGPLEIDLAAREVKADDRPIDLTTKEFALLAFLAARPGHTFSRAELLRAVWQSSPDWQQSATVTEHVRRLRTKIEPDPRHPEMLTTVRGAGYRLDLPSPGSDAGKQDVPPLGAGSVIHVGGRIVAADAAALEILGYTEEDDVLGKDLLDFVAGVSHDDAAERLARTGSGQARRSQMMTLQRLDGNEITVEVGSSTVTWEGRRAGRVELLVSADPSARLRHVVTGVHSELSDAVIVTDLHFHVRSWNGAAERLYGWTEQEAVGRHVLDIFDWEGNELSTAARNLEITGRWHAQGRQRTRDGSLVEVRSSMTMMHDESGEAVGVVSVNRPVLPPLDLRDGPVGLDAGDVRRGLDAQEFEVHYQPVVALADGSLLAVEALVRWQHPVRGVLRPDAFIETAERNGLIIELGAFVLDTASRQVAAWRASGANVGLSMNVSATELADPGLVDRIIVTIDAAGLEPHALWLEVTETTLVRDVDQAAAMLHRLADLGIGIAIDDFGTGWASLTYLSKFPIHALKIDRIFVAGIDENANDRVIARSIVQLGAELGLAVVAEGIETVTQCEAVQALGCLVGQGHLLGRPTPADAVPLHLAPRLETVDAAVDLLRQAERLTEETNHDLLTGLANRRVLDRVLPRIDDGVIVMIDLDHFKAVNDGSGHAAGDAVLARFGRMLADEVRTSDTTCRVGGEEFVMVLPGVDVATAVELVDRIRGTWVLAAPQPITFSAGMAAVSDTGGTAAFLAADQAMYLAKSNGRNRTELAADR
ncbi:MAG: EAL domain-containing protein [Acidimicrobiales bacterium]